MKQAQPYTSQAMSRSRGNNGARLARINEFSPHPGNQPPGCRGDDPDE
jgi:hypothetical protein